MLAEETGACYLCGLLHNIGKLVTLAAVHELAQRVGKKRRPESRCRAAGSRLSSDHE
jgi:HD-like signal output (HDOD) protein